MSEHKCAHCRRRPAGRKKAITADDGSTLAICTCGKQWVRATRPPPTEGEGT